MFSDIFIEYQYNIIFSASPPFFYNNISQVFILFKKIAFLYITEPYYITML